MRRTYHFGSYKYDPGKYGSARNGPGGDMLQRRMSVNVHDGFGSRLNIRRRKVVVTKNENASDDGGGGGDKKEEGEKADVEESVKEGGVQEDNNGSEMTVLAEEEDEVDAPWNQYAWIEEMQLRVR